MSADSQMMNDVISENEALKAKIKAVCHIIIIFYSKSYD